MLIKKVLEEIENSDEGLTITELSHKLNTEPGALQGIIQYWVKKGHIQEVTQKTVICEHCSFSCNTTCGYSSALKKSYVILSEK
ncbi:MAG: hypothetical protein JXA19_04315 [Anaerolineales bacterium]|nr:hypothetical protein [Anaerolineales bacterium]